MLGRLCGPCCTLLGLVLLIAPLHATSTEEADAEEFMKELDTRFNYECNKEMEARWGYITDVTDSDKEVAANEAAVNYLSFKRAAADNCSDYEYEDFQSIELYRRFRFLSKQGPGALDQAELSEFKALQAHMETTYSTATICDYNNPEQCGLVLEPDIEAIMASSTNWDELKYVWEEWREQSGKKMRNDFVRFVELSNKAATLDGFENTGEYWLNGYTVDKREAEEFTNAQTLNPVQFREKLSTVWNQVSEGLYKKLHSYVRMRLQDVYPDKIDPNGHIPSHILGNMWAQSWGNIARHVMPFPDMPTFDVTDSMVANNWDIIKMFKTAEDFFNSIGLFNMTPVFWEKSVINQTAWGKTIVCHASAEDFCLGPEGDDYRIKMCTDVNMEDLITVHHEMGHIEYFMAYKNLPHVFRDSANPGFHEAIGDLIALSVSTPDHLENILGLTPTKTDLIKNSKYTDDEMRDLNFLMQMALDKIAFLPFGYLIDKYRWSVYDGTIPTTELNAGWWNLRESLQGVTTPEGARGEEFFDPGAKYHVPANVPYIRYFVSFIVQFQFHARLCEAAGHDGPLHSCDIYGKTEAGDILRSALEKGFSEPWPLVLKELGGSEDIDPAAIMKYFEPLMQYLDQVLEENNQCIGWGDDCDAGSTESPSQDEAQALEDMDQMDYELTLLVQTAIEYDWNYFTNASNETAIIANEAWGNVSSAFREWHNKTIAFYDYEEFENEALVRRFRLQETLGTAALPDEDIQKLNDVVKNMTSTYNGARVKNNTNNDFVHGIKDLEVMMTQIRNEEDLKYYWTQWREESGKQMKDNYMDYIELLNKAATNDINGFADAGEMWLKVYAEPSLNYTVPDFKTDIGELWKSLKELYRDLHAYVRFKLIEHYTDDVIDSAFIPAHLLGNMWAQSWENVYDIVAPYSHTPLPDITTALEENVDDVREMVSIAENFFTSLRLYNMTADFNASSVFEQNKEESVICHASAWDFYDIVDDPSEGRFRIKMCTEKNQEDFIVIHHEMGHIQYMMSYSSPSKERPLVFRDGANPGFHEAIGDTIALSVSTPKHLRRIEEYLYGNETDSLMPSDFEPDYDERDGETEHKENINFLMKTALAKIPMLPYAYILDQWRWQLFADNNENDDFNKQWWTLRLDEQGICPPEKRFPSSDFDAGSKYHVATNVPYIRYFVAHILQFQFHQRLCSIANEEHDKEDVFDCDIYENVDAGDELKKLLHVGASIEWHKQLQSFMNSTEGNMDANAILDYFSPLHEFLKDFINNHPIEVGWKTGKIDEYMKAEEAYIPATVPIIVGVVLAAMVLIVIVAYFVGRARQRKVAKNSSAEKTVEDTIEITVQSASSRSTDSSD